MTTPMTTDTTTDTVEAATRVVADRINAIIVERADGQVDVQPVTNITAVKSHVIPWSRVTKAYAALRGMTQCPTCTGLGMVPPRR